MELAIWYNLRPSPFSNAVHNWIESHRASPIVSHHLRSTGTRRLAIELENSPEASNTYLYDVDMDFSISDILNIIRKSSRFSHLSPDDILELREDGSIMSLTKLAKDIAGELSLRIIPHDQSEHDTSMCIVM